MAKIKEGDAFRTISGGLVTITRKPRAFQTYYDIVSDGHFFAYGNYQPRSEAFIEHRDLMFNSKGECITDHRFDLILGSRNAGELDE